MSFDYQFTDNALDDIRVLLPYYSMSRVRSMVSNSVPVTHKVGNRGFEGFVFRVVNKRVLAVGLKKKDLPGRALAGLCIYCQGTKKVTVFDVCPICEGVEPEHCSCAGAGVRRMIPCPSCTKVRARNTY